MMWFAAERYLHCMTGMSHLHQDGQTRFEHKYGYKTFEPNESANLTLAEMDGLRCLHAYLMSIGESTAHKQIVQVDLLHQSLRVR